MGGPNEHWDLCKQTEVEQMLTKCYNDINHYYFRFTVNDRRCRLDLSNLKKTICYIYRDQQSDWVCVPVYNNVLCDSSYEWFQTRVVWSVSTDHAAITAPEWNDAHRIN